MNKLHAPTTITSSAEPTPETTSYKENQNSNMPLSGTRSLLKPRRKSKSLANKCRLKINDFKVVINNYYCIAVCRLAQSVQILVGLAVFCTYGLQYYVCLEIVWSGIKDRYTKNARFAEYVVRTLLTAAAGNISCFNSLFTGKTIFIYTSVHSLQVDN